MADTEAWLYPQNEAFVARLEELHPRHGARWPGNPHLAVLGARLARGDMPMLLEALGE